MKTYSYEEVMADAGKHEGVELAHKSDNHHGVEYLRLYSQEFPRLNGEKTVNDLLERIKSFMNNQDYMLPRPDISPQTFGDQYKYLVYRVVGREPVLAKLSLEFISGHNDGEELLAHLQPNSNETCICVVFVETREASYHQRKLN